jgi:hypothetical protein
MKPAKFALLALVLALATSLAYFSLTPFAIAGVLATVHPSCDDDNDYTTHASSKWDQAALILNISEPQTCGESLQSWQVQRFGNRLFVRTSFLSKSGEVAACMCRQNLSLRVPSLPKGSYAITVYNLP